MPVCIRHHLVWYCSNAASLDCNTALLTLGEVKQCMAEQDGFALQLALNDSY